MSFVRPAELRTPHLSVGRLRVEAAASGCAAAGGAALRRRDVLSAGYNREQQSQRISQTGSRTNLDVLCPFL